MNDAISQQLHQAFGRALLDRLQSGEASAGDFEVVRKWLKDNNINSTPEASPELPRLAHLLPVKDDEEAA
jgi:hypothetical protein